MWGCGGKMTEILEDLLKQLSDKYKILPVCSYDDCRKVRIDSVWLELPYKPKEIKYTHGICPECKDRWKE